MTIKNIAIVLILTGLIIGSVNFLGQKTDHKNVLNQDLGKTSTFEGYAKDTKAGAIVRLGTVQSYEVYIEGLDFWPEELRDKKIVVTGKLVKKKYAPDPQGEQYVLEQAQVHWKGETERARAVGAISLTKESSFPASLSEGRKALIAALQEKGEDPAEFYATIESESERIIVHLWHRSAFYEENIVAGNPGGKCRDVILDPKTQQVRQILFWQ